MIFNNDLYIAKVTVEEYGAENGGRRFYNLKGIKIDPAGGTPDAKTSYGTMPDARSEYSVSDLYALVKSHDKDFKSQPSSKVVNADGTPKVVCLTRHWQKNQMVMSQCTIWIKIKPSSASGRLGYNSPGL